ncbi:NADP-binding protein [Gigaspora margarita]|uniref:NADP-binding protein n=1 Tax=Gigaspora margarita TaxID=4874 RepID=A0A8H3X8I9_GIGMA|nr:NADP-binding protein [Gigaspora margarita]
MSSIVKPSILSLSPKGFASFLRSHGIGTFHAIFDPKIGKIVTSHPVIQPIVDYFIEEKTDFDEHEGIFGQIGPVSGVLQGAFIHRTCRGQGAGGVRNWSYNTIEDWFRDGIRLSKGMTHKNALAELWWGGGKGVIDRSTGIGLNLGSTPLQRRVVFEEYGSFISSLKGCYITAEDVGVKDDDMAAIFLRTRFTTCIPPQYGGSGNPSSPTASGVVRALEAAFSHIGKNSLEGVTVAVQGVGHVATAFIKYLLEKKVGRVISCDVDSQKIKAAEKTFSKEVKDGIVTFRLAKGNDHSILFEDVDAVSPCGIGGILNDETIPKIKAKIVCGAANNQLQDLSKDGKLLAERGIVYVPDFLANRMGIVNCADEASGYVENDPISEKHLGDTWENSIYNLTKSVLSTAAASSRTPQEVAIELAEKRSFVKNPIFGHRGIQIINSVVNSKEWKMKINAC